MDSHPYLPGLRVRHDGWTRERVQRFLDLLAYSGCVRDACRVTGLSNHSAYRQKRRFPRFSKAWDDALERAGQGLEAVAYKRAVEGRETIIIRKGEEVERRITPSDSLLGLLLKRGDLAGGALPKELKDLAGLPREEIITWPEWRDGHIRFGRWGHKYKAPDPQETERKLSERCTTLMNGLRAKAQRGEVCPCCDQTLPPGWPKQSLMAMRLLGVVDINDHVEGIATERD
ncbi:MAG: hypothetical protein ABI668_02585 [Sphingorhabdus sp.]